MRRAFDGPRLGVAYYPEQWPRERWETDARLMAEAGLAIVRLGEFAWAQLEPEEGRFDFEWLDEAIAILADAGLEIVLGTPTAAPPIWLVERHPEILPVDAGGRRAPFGHRRHYCPNQPAFRSATDRIVVALAERYGDDARVVAWQIDNELGGRCFCDACRAAFHDWLRRRYGTLETLNESWGTAFWSQTYSAWEQVPVPAVAPVPLPRGFVRHSPNPGLALDFRRFASDSLVRYQRLQLDALRAHVQQPITHNLMGFRFPEVDYHELARELDFVSWDNYPLLDDSGRWSTAALNADAMRGLKNAPVWVLEQQAGPLGWEVLRTPSRGQTRLFTYQAIAHGAEAVVYFRWRTARFGTEQYWHGVLDHDGRAGRRYEEVRSLAGELAGLRDALAGVVPHTDAALLHDYDSRFALEIQPTNAALGYVDTSQRHYEALRRLDLGVAVVSPAAALERYGLVVAAGLFVVDPALAATLTAYVEGGGTLVLAPRVGVKDRTNALPERPFPAWLDELAGLEVSDYASVPEAQRVRFAGDDGARLSGAFAGWYEELRLKGARPLAVYLEGAFSGSPAIAEHAVGAGRVVYLAGAADEPTLRRVYRTLCDEARIAAREVPEGIELVRLANGERELAFVLNHTGAGRTVQLGDGGWTDLVAGVHGEGALALEPFGVALVDTAAGVAVAAEQEGRASGADR